MEALYAFSREIADLFTLSDLLRAVPLQIASMLQLNVVLLVPDGDGRLCISAADPSFIELDDLNRSTADWVLANDHPAGHGTDTHPNADLLYLPLRTSRGPLGVVGVSRTEPPECLSPEERRLLDSLLDQAAVAIERVRLADERDQARLAAESERLRAALLTSLSHDLKTPLASITGAVTALRQYDELYDAAARDELAGTIQDEAERLSCFVANLLDMTRLAAGAIALNRELVDVGEVVGTALQRTTSVLLGHHVTVDLAPDLPMLNLDVVLFEQVLVNLLDNAAKYAPPGSGIVIQGRQAGKWVVLQVCDEGPGIPPGDVERVFETFYRANKGDRQRAGTGLGLAICRGFIEALGGTITATNRRDRSGAVFTITLSTEAARLCKEAAE